MKKALVLTLAFVLGLGIAAFAQPLSGSWGADITLQIDGLGNITVSAFSSDLLVDYTIGGWVFGSDTGFTLAGWATQSFSADGALGAFSFASVLVFNPAGASFTSWDTTASVSIAGIAFDAQFLLQGAPDWGAGWTFGASGVAGDIVIGAVVYFNMDAAGNLVQTGDCCICFTGIDIDVTLPFCCYLETIDVSLSFGCVTGFEGVCFSVGGIAVPAWPWLTFDAELCFYTGELGKVLTLTPALDLGEFACITLYYALVYDGATSCDDSLIISGVEFYGLELSCDIGGCTFSSLSSFNEVDYDLVKDPYWEVFTIECDADGCCGGLFSFAVSTYFDCESTMLFDWGETDVELSFGLGSNLTISTGLVVDATGFTEWTIGFDFAF